MRPLRRFSSWANRNPLLAVWLGFVVAFLLMYLVAPRLIERADQPSHYVKGAM